MDTQQIEIIGGGLLTANLIAGGVEVARPERDRGIDLIAYVDTFPGGFAACPIQMKAFTDQLGHPDLRRTGESPHRDSRML